MNRIIIMFLLLSLVSGCKINENSNSNSKSVAKSDPASLFTKIIAPNKLILSDEDGEALISKMCEQLKNDPDSILQCKTELNTAHFLSVQELVENKIKTLGNSSQEFVALTSGLSDSYVECERRCISDISINFGLGAPSRLACFVRCGFDSNHNNPDADGPIIRAADSVFGDSLGPINNSMLEKYKTGNFGSD